MNAKSVFLTSAFLITALSPGLARAAPQLSAIDLAPHRAIYDMTLREASAASNVSDVRGRLVFDFEGSGCAGYTLKSRLVTEVVDREGNSTVTDLRSSTWENSAGDSFRFENSQYIGPQLSEQVSGEAARRHRVNGIEVNLKEPARRKLKFDERALFPTQHSIAILQAAERGDQVLQADIFDGSEQGNKLFKTTTFIGKPILPGAKPQSASLENSGRLDELKSWPVSISYYDSFTNPAQDDGLPTYELSFKLFANGVSRDLLINYGTFLIRGELTRIDFHEPAKCPAKKQ
jgi:hypothetical protein